MASTIACLYRGRSTALRTFVITFDTVHCSDRNAVCFKDLTFLLITQHRNKAQIARQLRTQYVEGIYRSKYYTVALKSKLRVTQGHWKRNHWIDHTQLFVELLTLNIIVTLKGHSGAD